jgi:hypothetical protein
MILFVAQKGDAMPQLSLYLDKATLEIVEKNAQLEKTSFSKYVAGLIKSHSEQNWPTGFWGLFGSIDDESFGIAGGEAGQKLAFGQAERGTTK